MCFEFSMPKIIKSGKIPQIRFLQIREYDGHSFCKFKNTTDYQHIAYRRKSIHSHKTFSSCRYTIPRVPLSVTLESGGICRQKFVLMRMFINFVDKVTV